MQIELFDQKNIDQLVWPESEEATAGQAHLLPMIKEGVKKFIANVETQLYLLRVNSHILPLTVNEQEYENSYLTSNYFPIKYLEERLGRTKRLLAPLYRQLLKGAGLFLKGIKINKVVIVNNWL